MITIDTNIQLTKNFKLSEFTCHCGKNHVELDMELVTKLQALRDLLGSPVNVAVGYRCPAHNANVPGAADNSCHIYGRAADIKCPGHTPEEIAYLAIKVGFAGVGLYDTWVHVCVGHDPSFWDKREKNKGREIKIPIGR